MAEDIGLFEAIYSQRALRYFKPDPVDDSLIWKVLDAGIRAPSGSNSQGWGFVVIRESTRQGLEVTAFLHCILNISGIQVSLYFDECVHSLDWPQLVALVRIERSVIEFIYDN